MKKLVYSLLLAACLPGLASASTYSREDSQTFSALSSSASFLLNWVDAISSKTTKSGVETKAYDGSYSFLLTDAATGKVLDQERKLNLNDTSSATSGSYQWTFSNLVANKSYTLSLVGKWTGVADSGKWSLATAPSVSVTPVPEPETYAMFLAGLGVIGMIARRRKAA
jgi:hypothetical protein